jgi:hypothetical protein
VRIQGQALYDKEGKIIKYFAIEEDTLSKGARVTKGEFDFGFSLIKNLKIMRK